MEELKSKKLNSIADKKAMNALFIMCTALRKEVAELRAELKELRKTKRTGITPEVVMNII